MACVWLLAVMDPGDNSRRFVASLLVYHERGFITDRQMEALRSIVAKIIRRHLDGDLQCQGASPATVQTLTFGEVIDLAAVRANAREVLE
ncbi:hypothetical protein LAZ29_12955 [Cereibacter sphaeroides]|uniref:hypothetical protein n=1 Tax=Cereibacter sphaeroides TaxID=1063 RepID=UPI001F2D13C5|nr:hypothetical protein [Cereibacter sphaeroides]MCE6951838.1 hypothetical protein [Cereibacter sphaeroides]